MEEIKKLRLQKPGIELCYFYCSILDPSALDIDTLLRRFLKDLCSSESTPKPIQDLYDQCRNSYPPDTPSVKRLESALKAVLRSAAGFQSQTHEYEDTTRLSHAIDEGARVYLLVDGLDEVPKGDRRPFFNLLQNLMNLRLPNLSLLVMSRYQPDISETFATDWTSIPIRQCDVKVDVQRFVFKEIERNPALVTQSQEIKEAISSRLTGEENASQTNEM